MKEFNEISQKSPFKVPENYFEEVNRKIIASTSDHDPHQKEKSIYRRLRPYLAVAATIAVLTLISFTVFHIISSGKNKPIMPEITLNEFSDNWLNDIDLMTLEEKTGYIEPDLTSININSKEIIDYLVFENIEIIDIYEQQKYY
jgi:hypothetical protein